MAVQNNTEPTNEGRKERTNGRPNELVNGRTDGRTKEQPIERAKVRHSFDVYKDQLLALNQLQAEAVLATGRKPGISEMVQEALDKYLSRGSRKN